MFICHSVRVFGFVQTISPEPLNHFKPNLVLWCTIMSQIVRKKEKKKKVPYCQCQGHNEGLYNQNMTISTIFQTAGPFAIKLSLVVQHYKPECPAEKLDYCIQGQGHSENLKYQ